MYVCLESAGRRIARSCEDGSWESPWPEEAWEFSERGERRVVVSDASHKAGLR